MLNSKTVINLWKEKHCTKTIDITNLFLLQNISNWGMKTFLKALMWKVLNLCTYVLLKVNVIMLIRPKIKQLFKNDQFKAAGETFEKISDGFLENFEGLVEVFMHSCELWASYLAKNAVIEITPYILLRRTLLVFFIKTFRWWAKSKWNLC